MLLPSTFKKSSWNLTFMLYFIRPRKMLPPGFEPGSWARKAYILDRTRLRGRLSSFVTNLFIFIMGRAGFEPAILATSRRCLNRARPPTHSNYILFLNHILKFQRREWDLNPQGLSAASLAD